MQKYFWKIPNYRKWRENLVTELLENITENKITDFDIGEISNIQVVINLKRVFINGKLTKSTYTIMDLII